MFIVWGGWLSVMLTVLDLGSPRAFSFPHMDRLTHQRTCPFPSCPAYTQAKVYTAVQGEPLRHNPTLVRHMPLPYLLILF